MSRSFGSTPLTTRPSIATVPAVIVLEPGHHAQQGRLPAARRPDHDHQLAIRDRAADAVHDLAVAIGFAQLVEGHGGHRRAGRSRLGIAQDRRGLADSARSPGRGVSSGTARSVPGRSAFGRTDRGAGGAVEQRFAMRRAESESNSNPASTSSSCGSFSIAPRPCKIAISQSDHGADVANGAASSTRRSPSVKRCGSHPLATARSACRRRMTPSLTG